MTDNSDAGQLKLITQQLYKIMPKKYLTVIEVARIFGVTPLTVRNWDKKNKLNAYRNPVNNYRLYKIDEVETLIKLIDSSKRLDRSKKSDSSRIRKINIELI